MMHDSTMVLLGILTGIIAPWVIIAGVPFAGRAELACRGRAARRRGGASR